MGKRSKFNRILSFVLSLSLVGGDILPAFAAGDDDAQVVTIEEVSGEESASEDEAGSVTDGEASDESVSADDTAEVSGNEAADEEVSEEADSADTAAEEEALLTDVTAEEADPADGEELIDFEFVPGYVEMPDSEGLSVVDDGISFRQIKAMLVDDEDDGEYADDYAAKTDKAYPCKYTETASILDYLNGFPVPRNQNPYGSCWAHSAVGLAEFYLIKHGMADTTVDLSELHLVNYCYVQGTPSIAGDTGDKVYFSPTGSNPNILDAGGNLNYAAQTLLHQRGYASESDVPYSQATTVLASGIDPSLERKDVAYLKNAMEISMSNTALIKQCIIDNGIVGVSICASDSYYSNTYNSFYCYNTPATNHAVDLVGWDDDFPAGNFVTTAPGNGAWLVRNSWNYYGDTRLHYYTYFWISYYDHSLTEKNGSYEKSAWTYEMMDPDDFPGNSYYYDSEIHNSGSLTWGSGDLYSANIFKASSGADKEIIEAVTFSAGSLASSGTSYEIKIYTGVNPSGSPTSGTLQSSATTTGTLTLSGMYTIELNAPVTVNKGDYFSVVVKRNDSRTVNYEAGYSGNNGVSYTVGMQSGQSFISNNGSSWTDLTSYDFGGNLVIGALTSDKNEDKSAVTLSDTSLTLTSAAPAKTLTATVYNADGSANSEAVVSWKSSNTAVATVDSEGTVTAVASGTAVITAKYGTLKATCNVTVTRQKAATPGMDKTSGSLNIGDTLNVSCATAGAKIYYTMDGTAPTDSSDEVSGGKITIPSGTPIGTLTIKLRAYADYYDASDIAVFSYTIESLARVQLNENEKELTSTEYQTVLTALVYGDDGLQISEPDVTWTSSNTAVATVDDYGMVTAVANGTADITAVSGGKSAKCTVTVNLSKVALPSADKINGTELEQGSSITVSCATEGAAVYYTLDGTDPTVSSTKVTGPIAIGSEYAGQSITLKLKAFADHYTDSDVATYNYTVESKADITLFDTTLTLTTASPVAVLTATVKKADGTDDLSPVISWSSSKPAVATVANGTVTAVSSGTTDITATANGKTAVCVVTVSLSKVASPAADKADGSELEINSSITVSCATEGAATYYTLDGTTPTRTSSAVTGPITIGPVYAGKNITLKLRSYAAHYEASDVVTYAYTVESKAGIELSDTTLTLTTASPVAVLSATVKKADGTEDTSAVVSWTSSVGSVAAVDAGTVTAISEGTTVITAQSGDFTAICTVTVTLSQASAPVADKADNSTIFTGDVISVTCATAGAKVYYTLDGTEPITGSKLLNDGKITIGSDIATGSLTIKLRAFADLYRPSDIASYTYTVENRSGLSLDKTSLELTSAAPAASLTATVTKANGDTDTSATVTWTSSKPAVATVTNGVVTAVSSGETVITAKSGSFTADCTVTVTILKAATPTADKASGTVLPLDSRTVNVSSATTGAALYYTLNGDEPTKSSSSTTGAITVPDSYAGKSVTIKVRAYADYYDPSDVAEFNYTVESKARVELSETEIELTSTAPQKTLTAKAYNANGSEKTGASFTWSSSDISVATVTGGTVTAVANGSAVITAKSSDLSATCVVTVNFSKVAKPVADIADGSEIEQNTAVSVSCATSGATMYYTLDGTDPTTGSAVTTGIINIGSAYAGKNVTVKVRAYAKNYDPSEVAVYTYSVKSLAAVRLSASALELTSDKPYATLTARVYEADGRENKDASLTWSSSDTAVATVDAGKITAVGSGEAIITAKSGIYTASCSVKVTVSQAAKPTADKESGTQLQINTSVNVSCDTQGAKLYYTLDGSEPDESSAQTTGLITFGKEYAAQNVTLKIRAYAAHYNASETAVYEYSFEDRTLVVMSTPVLEFTKAGDTATLTATVFSAAGDVDAAASVTWTSSDAAVATVENGVVTAVAEGEALITAAFGTHKAECSVKVTIASSQKKQTPYTVSITPSEVIFRASGEVMKLAVTVKDKDGVVINAPALTFKSSDELVATVDDKGLITAGSPGKANITVKCGSRSAVCSVSVEIVRPEIVEEETYYTVSFYANGSLYSNVQVLKGRTIGDMMPADPAGQFICWIDSETSEVWNSSSPVYKDHTLEANFEEERRSAYDPVPDLEKIELYLVKGQKVQLDANTKWVLDKQYNTILSLTKKGLLTAKNVGEAVVVSDPAGTEYTVYVVQPVITNKRMTLMAGETGEFELDLGSHSEGYEVAWSSSAPAIATVNGGKVYAIAKGSATITATVNGKAYTCSVKVNELDSKVAVREETTAITLMPLQSVNTKLKGVWTSDIGMYKYGKNAKKPDYSDGVVYITAAGKMTAIGSGTTTVTVTTDKGEVRSFRVTVTKPVEQVQYLANGKSKTLKFTNVKAVSSTWSARNIESLSGSDVVSVNPKNGAVKALSAGIAEVSCTYSAYPSVPGSGFTYITRIYVEEPALEEAGGLVKANANGTVYKLENIEAGSTVALKYVKNAAHAVYQPVVYKSSKPEVAYVDERGVVHAKSSGKAKITFKINGKTYSINVVVK